MVKIKGIVFDVGQTLVDRPSTKKEVKDNDLKFYSYVYKTFNQQNYQQHFPGFASFSEQDFCVAVDDSIWSHKANKNNEIITTEFRLCEHIFELLSKKSLEMDANFQVNKEEFVEKINVIVQNKKELNQSQYELWPDTIQILDWCQQNGIRLGLASNSAHAAKHEMLLENCGIKKYFDPILISSYIGIRKPNPEMLRIIVEDHWKLQKDEVCVIGDMLDRDMLIANLYGCHSIWVNLHAFDIEHNIKRMKENNPQFKFSVGITCLSQVPAALTYIEQQPFTEQQIGEQIRIGYYLPHKKKKLACGLKKCFQPSAKILYIPIEPRVDLEQQGPFHMIVQKLLDLYQNNETETIENFMKFTQKHPEIIILDQVQACFSTLDRNQLNTLLRQSFGTDGTQFQNFKIRIPFNLRIDSPQEAIQNQQSQMFQEIQKVQFPILVKTSAACLTKTSHTMYLCFNQQGLIEAIQYYNEPIVLQEFIQHSGVVFKIYVCGRFRWIEKRPSFPDVERPEQNCIRFDSQKKLPGSNESSLGKVNINEEAVDKAIQLIEQNMGMTMYGFDFLVQNNTQDHVCIDLNYFPGYKEVQNYNECLETHFLEFYQKHKK